MEVRFCTNEVTRIAATSKLFMPNIVTLKVTIVIMKEATVRVTALLHRHSIANQDKTSQGYMSACTQRP